MSNIEDIIVVPGSNKELAHTFVRQRGSFQQANDTDPHGFFECGYTQEQVEQVCGLYREKLLDLLKQIPDELALRTVQRHPKIELYGLKAPQNKSHIASTLWLQFQGRSSQELHSLGGILLCRSAEEFLSEQPKVMNTIYHENAHLVTHSALGACETVDEAFAHAIDQRYCPDPSDPKYHPALDPDAYTGTTGLRFADHSQSPMNSRAYNNAERMIAAQTFRHQTREQLWDIVLRLIHQADQQGQYPSFQVIQQTITDELKSDAQDLFQDPVFRPMRAGEHLFIFPKKNTGSVGIHAFDAIAGQEISLQDKPIQFEAESDRSSEYKLNGALQCSVDMQFSVLKQSMANAPVDWRSIQNFRCRVNNGSFFIDEHGVSDIQIHQ